MKIQNPDATCVEARTLYLSTVRLPHSQDREWNWASYFPVLAQQAPEPQKQVAVEAQVEY